MPRKQTQFRHEVKWAPDMPDTNGKYSARLQGVVMKRGKITCIWTIYKSFTKAKRKAKAKEAIK